MSRLSTTVEVAPGHFASNEAATDYLQGVERRRQQLRLLLLLLLLGGVLFLLLGLPQGLIFLFMCLLLVNSVSELVKVEVLLEGIKYESTAVETPTLSQEDARVAALTNAMKKLEKGIDATVTQCERSVGTVFQLPNPDAIYSRDKEKERKMGRHLMFVFAHGPRAAEAR
jgi:Na+-transporting methylmalonyl-CoA/oxaloacetate decarboxylase gamma subunit